MKVNGNAIKPGMIIQHEGGLWVAVKTAHVKPGKGGAFAQVELKNLIDGRKLNERFRSDDNVERVRLDQKEYSYLYDSGDVLVFMDQTTYEQIELQKDWVGEERVPYLQDGMVVTIEFHEERPIGLTLPEQVILDIVDTEPTIKGQTASSSYKPATASNGMRVMIPPLATPSALLHVMIDAARKAGRGLARDFGEVAELQVSKKGTATSSPPPTSRPRRPCSSCSARRAPATASSARSAADRGQRQEPHLDRRPARRHHQLHARHAALRGQHRPAARRPDRRRRDLQPATATCSGPRRARAPSSTTSASARRRPQRLDEAVIATGIPSSATASTASSSRNCTR
jgi:elongation factor P